MGTAWSCLSFFFFLRVNDAVSFQRELPTRNGEKILENFAFPPLSFAQVGCSLGYLFPFPSSSEPEVTASGRLRGLHPHRLAVVQSPPHPSPSFLPSGTESGEGPTPKEKLFPSPPPSLTLTAVLFPSSPLRHHDDEMQFPQRPSFTASDMETLFPFFSSLFLPPPLGKT